MRTSICKYALVVLGLLILLPEGAEAGRRRRSSGNNYSSGNYSSGSSTSSSTVPTLSTLAPGQPKKRRFVIGKLWRRSRADRSEYDYNWAAKREWHNEDAKAWLFSDRVRIKLNFREDLAKISDELKVKLTWNYMHKSKHVMETWASIEHDGDDRFVDLTGLEEGRLVMARVEIYRPTTEQNAARDTADGGVKIAPVSLADDKGFDRVGAIHAPYYGVTGSETNEEWQRRAQIVSFSFSQWYHDEAYGGRYCNYDCWSFYKKSADSELSGFAKKSIANSDVPKLSKEGKRFHGDYLIMSGHYGMALCYDEDRNHFCSIEGNYALSGPHRIQIDKHYHNLNTWHTIMGLVESPKAEAKPAQPVSKTK